MKSYRSILLINILLIVFVLLKLRIPDLGFVVVWFVLCVILFLSSIALSLRLLLTPNLPVKHLFPVIIIQILLFVVLIFIKTNESPIFIEYFLRENHQKQIVSTLAAPKTFNQQLSDRSKSKEFTYFYESDTTYIFFEVGSSTVDFWGFEYVSGEKSSPQCFDTYYQVAQVKQIEPYWYWIYCTGDE